MAAKVQWMREAWWVVTHYDGKRKKRRIGPTKDHKRQAVRIAEKLNAQLALGSFKPNGQAESPLQAADELRRWLANYSPTLKPSTRSLAEGVIERHLAPFFGARDLREIGESDLLAYVTVKLEAKRAARTIRNDLALLQRVYNILGREGKLNRNPASHLGEIMRRVAHASASEVEQAEAWSESEVHTLLDVARGTEPRFAPFLALLFATGMRRGEAIGLKWRDVDFSERMLTVRRAITKDGLTTTKSGRARRVPIAPGLLAELENLRVSAAKEALQRGWPDSAEWVFPSESGTPLEPRNVERVWHRVRRRAAKQNVRPLKLHSTRHTWATLALRAGKSVRWVAEVLGHQDPAFTLRTYAHVMRDEERDFSFADFGGPGRPYTAPRSAPIKRAELRARRMSKRIASLRGAPGGIRTPDPQVRSLMLYPAELPARVGAR